MAWTTPRTWTTGELVTAAIMNTHVRDNLNVVNTSTVQGIIGGTGAAITAGSVFDFEVPFNCTVSRWTLMANSPSSLELEVWAVSYAGAPPVAADDITATSPMTLASARYGQNTNPANWSAMTGGEVGTVTVIAASGITQATVSLILSRT